MRVPPPETSLASGGRTSFQNTLWSRVFAAGKSDAARPTQALEELCRLYWHPIYQFLRRHGHDRERARDLTQAFFAYLIQGKVLRKAIPERGRFRSFLLGTLKNFASHEAEKALAVRRGGTMDFVSIDEETAEGVYKHEPASNLTPEKLFDRRWALTVLEEATRRLRADYERAGMSEIFDALQPYLLGDDEGNFSKLGARLGRTEGAARVMVFRFRERFRQLIRAVIGDTVTDLEQVEVELKHLQAALRAT
jgi:RNA polymerase sigma-70 factor (ECF subfamily)